MTQMSPPLRKVQSGESSDPFQMHVHHVQCKIKNLPQLARPDG